MPEKIFFSSLNGTTRETQESLMSTFPFPNSSRTASPVRNKPFREHNKQNNGPISIF